MKCLKKGEKRGLVFGRNKDAKENVVGCVVNGVDERNLLCISTHLDVLSIDDENPRCVIAICPSEFGIVG